MRLGLVLLAFIAATTLPASRAGATETADAVLARYKAASGGARWDAIKTLQWNGTIASGGLDGPWRFTLDLANLRSSDDYRLGPIEGADGYDGSRLWRRDAGGEVALLDGPIALRRAHTQAWLDARAYWYPARLAASYGAVASQSFAGRRYLTIAATPQGGDPLTLWFDADSGLLARIVQPQGLYTATTRLDDYRETDGLRLPHHVSIDFTDAAGRTDPRRRIEYRYRQIAVNVALADADFAAPAMNAIAHVDAASGSTRVPFELLNRHIYVDADIDGQPAHLLVDSGGVNLLTPAAAHRFGLSSLGALAETGAGEQDMDLGYAHARQLRIGDAVIDQPVFEVLDLGDMPKVEGTAIDGFIGYETFRRFGVTIDYAHRTLSLSDPERYTPPPDAVALRFVQEDRAPIIEGKLDGIPLGLWVDTGSRSSLSFFAPFARRHQLLHKYHAAADTVIGWGLSGASRARPARLGELHIDKLILGGLAGDIATTDKGAFADPDLDADLGGNSLSRFTLGIDYAHKRLYLASNTSYGQADDFDRSGLWLLADGDALKIVDVAPGSAAARARLRVGDRIFAIAGEAVSRHSLSDWRALLRESPAGRHLIIQYRRDGRDQEVELALADRIAARWP